MSAKGYISGNDAADRMLESLRGRPADPWSQEEAARLVEWKHEIRRAVPLILAAERNRTIASLRARIGSLDEGREGTFTGLGVHETRRKVLAILDEMEQES